MMMRGSGSCGSRRLTGADDSARVEEQRPASWLIECQLYGGEPPRREVDGSVDAPRNLSKVERERRSTKRNCVCQLRSGKTIL